MPPSNSSWSTQQLVEFLDIVSSVEDVAIAADRAAERAAEALDAEIAAIVRGRSLVTSVGFPRGQVPAEMLVAAAHEETPLELEGLGRCSVLTVPIGDDAENRLLVGRFGEEPFEKVDVNVLRGMGRVLDLTLRLLHGLEKERSLREQNQRETREREHAQQEAQRLKNEFFALVSHELRTPLTSIIGYLDLISGDSASVSEKGQRSVEVIERNANRLLRLVGDLLFAAQLEAGSFEIEMGAVELDKIAAESIETAMLTADKREIELSAEIEPVPLQKGDPDRLAQALDNLLSNALKFTPAGGQVKLRLWRDADEILVSVSDTGIGVPEAERDRLFERFYRSSNALNGSAEGAGLGLSIVSAIIDGHGGTIAVESEEGVGTRILVRMPLNEWQGRPDPRDAERDPRAPRARMVARA
ncbi:MAG: hypothetical protein QOJ38_2027 [Solirubrobacterales bacterium]|jgi:signal transduction histidine kinase|nr:hypothetical protein [Solirubrobacterales bacterium]